MTTFSESSFKIIVALVSLSASAAIALDLDTGASRSTFITMADADCSWDADDRVWDEANDMMIRLPDHAMNGAAAWSVAAEEHGLDAACKAAEDIHDQYVKARYE